MLHLRVRASWMATTASVVRRGSLAVLLVLAAFIAWSGRSMASENALRGETDAGARALRASAGSDYRQAPTDLDPQTASATGIQPQLAALDGGVARLTARSGPAALRTAQAAVNQATSVVRSRQTEVSLLVAGNWRQPVAVVFTSCLLALALALMWLKYVRSAAARRRAEQELRQSEAQFRALFEDAPVACHELDREGRLRRVNRAQCQLLSYSAKEMLGRPIWEYVAPSVREAARLAVLERLRGGEAPATVERSCMRNDGSTFAAEVHESLIRDPQGRVDGLLGTMLDVTRTRGRLAVAVQPWSRRRRAVRE